MESSDSESEDTTAAQTVNSNTKDLYVTAASTLKERRIDLQKNILRKM